VSARRDRRAGFTFLEIAIVMVIIAMASALALPMIEGGFDSREVRRAARQIASTMHYCRGEAVSLGAPQELVIDTYRNTIHTTGWDRWAVLTDRAMIVDVHGGNQLGDGLVQVLFFPNGSTSGVDVQLASRRDRFTNRLLVSLDPLLGSVRVEDTST
jgi:general secretion pathway protein H